MIKKRLLVCIALPLFSLFSCDPASVIDYKLYNNQDTVLDLLMFNVQPKCYKHLIGEFEQADSLWVQVAVNDRKLVLGDLVMDDKIRQEDINWGFDNLFDSVQVYRADSLLATHTNKQDEWRTLILSESEYLFILYLGAKKE